MDTNKEQTKHNRLSIDVAALFECPYQWCIVDLVYFRASVNHGKWDCAVNHILQYSPVKRYETVLDTLERLVARNMGFTKIPFGKPQRRRMGKGRTTVIEVQSYQVVFDQSVFNKWLIAELEKLEAIRFRIDPYPKEDSPPIRNGIGVYTKTDSNTDYKQKKEKGEDKPLASHGGVKKRLA